MKDDLAIKTRSGSVLDEKAASGAALQTASERARDGRRNLVLGVVNVSHVFNHMQSGMLSVLYPVMMGELGFGYFQIGVLQTIYQLSAMGFQVVYGMLARFFPRAILLGVGNMICGAFYMTTGLAQNFVQIGAMRGLSGLGSSAQHPVGSAILVSYFEKARRITCRYTSSQWRLTARSCSNWESLSV